MLSNFNKFFKKKKKNNSSRNITGTKVIRTKMNIKYNDYLPYDKYRIWNTQTAVVTKILYTKSNNKYFFLIKYPNESVSIVKPIAGVFLGDFFKTIYFKTKYYLNKIIGFVVVLRNLKKGYIISNIYNNNAILSSSDGVFSQIISFNYDADFCIVQLPTKKKIYISLNSYVIVGRNTNILKKNIVYGKAGSLRKLGKKIHVRGVAMNPVDHPHGGRTKTNSPEVSIWGWVTKYNH